MIGSSEPMDIPVLEIEDLENPGMRETENGGNVGGRGRPSRRDFRARLSSRGTVQAEVLIHVHASRRLELTGLES